MRELEKKMFWLLFMGLTLLVLIITMFLDYREYVEARTEVQEILLQSNNNMERSYNASFYKAETFDDSQSVQDWDDEETSSASDSFYKEGQMGDRDMLWEHYAFITELPVFSVKFNWKTVQLALYQNAEEDQCMKAVSEAVEIHNKKQVGQMDVGNLLTNTYAWYYPSPATVFLVDVREVAEELYHTFAISLFIFVVFTIIFLWISRRIVKWMIEPIEKMFEKQKQFIADASHELKTPLAVILANAEAMEKNPDPKWIHNIETESERMNTLITGLLDLTRSEQRSASLHAVDFSKLVEKECLIQEAVIFEKGIELQEEIEPHIQVMGDSSQLGQVFSILLDNAIYHTAGKIYVSLKKNGNWAVLEVSNNGQAIPQEDQAKIFERFYRSDASRNRNENRYGLGLAIAKNIIHLFKGEIGVHSNEKQTTFYVKLKII